MTPVKRVGVHVVTQITRDDGRRHNQKKCLGFYNKRVIFGRRGNIQLGSLGTWTEVCRKYTHRFKLELSFQPSGCWPRLMQPLPSVRRLIQQTHFHLSAFAKIHLKQAWKFLAFLSPFLDATPGEKRADGNRAVWFLVFLPVFGSENGDVLFCLCHIAVKRLRVLAVEFTSPAVFSTFWSAVNIL